MGGQSTMLSLAAQIVNFLILVALLKWVLYDRVLRVLKARQEHVAERFRRARESQEKADQLAEDYRQRVAQLEEQQEKRLAEARQEVDEYRRTLTAEARDKVVEQEQRWSQSLQQQQATFARELGRQAATRICGIARQVLHDLAGQPLEDQIALGLIRRIEHMDTAALGELVGRMMDSNSVVSVHSAFELPDATRQRLESVLREKTGKDVQLQFQRDDQMTCGIILKAGSHKIAWSIDNYVEQLTRQVEQSLGKEIEQWKQKM